ncbi:Tat pathway signal sequence domain protein [Streptomyces orinoci]|uniref:XRE family transcriptional regulator n=1 Tax=Streptomyces orinoci TaxID=67339 RepID=A0ABV3JWU6_STRON|nr:Tat pathway signal sequence domain protein [Streptomyces orinoci]
MAANTELAARMAALGLTRLELAEQLNDVIEEFTGRRGDLSDRTIRRYLSGQTRWPQGRQRAALSAVFHRTPEELGFTPPSASAASKRNAHAVTQQIGGTEVQQLQDRFNVLVARDNRYGGGPDIEARAADLVEEALAFQRYGSVSRRVRSALYACAASFASSAMWAAIDSRRREAAEYHFTRASSLATVSGDQAIQFRIWSHAGSFYRHLGRPADALAANDVARGLPIARRDPMFAALGHARHAAIHGSMGNATGVRRALAHAHGALDRADASTRRPVWMTAVCDRAEIEELAVSAHLSLGDFPRAEAHAYRSLALLRPHMRRDRALVTARLACAQLGQGELELSLATAMTVSSGALAHHPRVAAVLNEFGARLKAMAPRSTHFRTWEEHQHPS